MKFRKKPIVVEAIKWTGKNTQEIVDWSNGIVYPINIGYGEMLKVSTKEGTMNCSIDDWIICGVQGEFYPCKPDIFAEIYIPEIEVKQLVNK